MNKLSKILSMSALFLFASSSMAEDAGFPEQGEMHCQSLARSIVPMGKTPADGAVLSSTTACTIAGSAARLNYMVNVEMDFANSKGSMLSGSGYTVDGAGRSVQTFRFLNGDWQLKMKEGKMVGWQAKGHSVASAGWYKGRKMAWTAAPTGAHTMKIVYQFQ